MKPLPHHYAVRLAGGPAGYATLSAPGRLRSPGGASAEFDGPARLGPGAAAARRRPDVGSSRCVPSPRPRRSRSSPSSSAEGTVDRKDGPSAYRDRARPRLTLAPGADRDRALRVLEKSEKGCLVSARWRCRSASSRTS
jgi:hypothetical protein